MRIPINGDWLKPRDFYFALLLTLTSGAIPCLSAAPVITSVVNAASYKDSRLPGAVITPGSIFIVRGSGLGPANIAIAPAAFQSTNLSGTSVRITVNSQTVNALMYYTSGTQVAALMPSSTSTGGAGTGNPNAQVTITVTYNGEDSAPTPFQGVSFGSPGLFTVDSSGGGPALVTYADYSLVSPAKAANCGGPNTACGSANPGDTLILWATGLGPVPAGDGPGSLGQSVSLPLTVWLGGVQAPVVYLGRSGCCIGLDQIVFTVPNNVPAGCAVPLVVQVVTTISNSTVMPVANGSRTCTPADPTVAAANLDQLGASGSFTFGLINLNRLLNDAGNNITEWMEFRFWKASGIPPGLQLFLASYLDQPPPGTCTVMGTRSSADLLFDRLQLTPLDAGTRFSIVGPRGSDTITTSGGRTTSVVLDGKGGVAAPGDYTLTGGPGTDVGAFTARLTIPPAPTFTSPASSNGLVVTRRLGMTVAWNPGAAGPVPLALSARTDRGDNTTAICNVLASSGSFTIPPYALLALPATDGTRLSFRPGDPRPVASALFSASGLNLGIMQSKIIDLTISGFHLQ
jgi:uncharacterized protein (TIGR03437 family)